MMAKGAFKLRWASISAWETCLRWRQCASCACTRPQPSATEPRPWHGWSCNIGCHETACLSANLAEEKPISPCQGTFKNNLIWKIYIKWRLRNKGQNAQGPNRGIFGQGCYSFAVSWRRRRTKEKGFDPRKGLGKCTKARKIFLVLLLRVRLDFRPLFQFPWSTRPSTCREAKIANFRSVIGNLTVVKAAIKLD